MSATVERLQALIRERGTDPAELLDPAELADRTALSEDTVRTLLRGGEPTADTVNDRVRTRIKALADAYLTRTGKRMSDLAGSISQQLGISAFWARKVCSGEKVPSVELLHGLVDFFGVKGGEAFFTAPASEALNQALLPMLAAAQPTPDRPQAAGDPLTEVLWEYDDVRGIALRQARDLPPERWKVLNATLKALLDLDDEGH
ncbi:hypothetical protein GT045_19425 [Streptomyces sp. SID486]|nr:hypothetical protein [Streptomyces sp. SID161]MYW48037.1 hypothetical protein [Streptomyces sp. SID161]MYX96929.1 hypothetical protein [Streptomyces sp. SID486]